MVCKHDYQEGKALINLATNGRTTDSSQWERGEGLYASRKTRTIIVDKCVHCGQSHKQWNDGVTSWD